MSAASTGSSILLTSFTKPILVLSFMAISSMYCRISSNILQVRGIAFNFGPMSLSSLLIAANIRITIPLSRVVPIIALERSRTVRISSSFRCNVTRNFLLWDIMRIMSIFYLFKQNVIPFSVTIFFSHSSGNFHTFVKKLPSRNVFQF